MGKFDQDPDLWPVARKLKGCQSWSIKSQKIVQVPFKVFRGMASIGAIRDRLDLEDADAGESAHRQGTKVRSAESSASMSA